MKKKNASLFLSAYSPFNLGSCLDGWQNPLVANYLHFMVANVEKGVSFLLTYDVMLWPIELKEVK